MATDCDDSSDTINPDARDLIGDEEDSNCDGVEYCYADLDGDGYRTSEVVESEDIDCSDAGEATSDTPLVDCDDSRAGVNPGAEEIAGDGIDQDCDGSDPEGDGVVSDDTATPSGGDDGASGADGDFSVDVNYPPEKGGCSTAGASPAGLSWTYLFGLAAILGFRRRE